MIKSGIVISLDLKEEEKKNMKYKNEFIVGRKLFS